jgi:uncharacterized protein (TIRG00374 family)
MAEEGWVTVGPGLRRGRWGIAFTVLGAAIFVAYLAYTKPFSYLAEAGRFDPLLFGSAVLLNWVGLVFLAASWHLLLRVLQVRTSLWRSVQMTFVSMFVVWLLPVPSGVEIIRAYLVRDEEGSNLGKAVSSVVVSKVYYFISFGVLVTLAAAITLMGGGEVPVQPAMVWFVVLYAFFNTLVFGLVLVPGRLLWLYEGSPGWIRRNILDRVYNPEMGLGGFPVFVDEMGKAMESLRKHSLENLLSLLMVGFHWSTGSVTAYLVAASLGQRINFWLIVLIYAVIEFIQQLNIVIPSGLGVVDAGLTGAFTVVGVPLEAASAISLLTRLATYWFELVLCGVVSLHFGYREALEGLEVGR